MFLFRKLRIDLPSVLLAKASKKSGGGIGDRGVAERNNDSSGGIYDALYTVLVSNYRKSLDEGCGVGVNGLEDPITVAVIVAVSSVTLNEEYAVGIRNDRISVGNDRNLLAARINDHFIIILVDIGLMGSDLNNAHTDKTVVEEIMTEHIFITLEGLGVVLKTVIRAVRTACLIFIIKVYSRVTAGIDDLNDSGIIDRVRTVFAEVIRFCIFKIGLPAYRTGDISVLGVLIGRNLCKIDLRLGRAIGEAICFVAEIDSDPIGYTVFICIVITNNKTSRLRRFGGSFLGDNVSGVFW